MQQTLWNKGYAPPAQFGMLLGFAGGGLIIGSVLGAIVLLAGGGMASTDLSKLMTDPANVTLLKWIQVLSTFTGFCLPAVLFAFLCYRNGWTALGFGQPFSIKWLLICLGLILLAGPAVDALGQLNKAIPLPAAWKAMADKMEKQYEEQVGLLAQVTTLGQFISSLLLVAVLPALFEELLFRGALQQVLERWFKRGWVAIVVASILFSAIHLSWYGFLPRVALGLLLGTVFYYTRNIWYAIGMHLLNNGVVVCYLYYLHQTGKPAAAAMEASFPWWVGLLSGVLVLGVFWWMRRQPHPAAPAEQRYDRHNPFA
jgi:membrane protease YdiL (CAAX protease family)